MNITIIGLGLIGGSIAKKLTESGHIVFGVDKNIEILKYGEKQNIIVKGYVNGEVPFKKSELLIFSIYPSFMLQYIKENKKYFKKNSLITDVCGIKSSYLIEVQNELKGICEFIGAHPMAGKEVSGILNCDSKIFENANFIITKSPKNTISNINKIKKLGVDLGFFNISVIDYRDHDQYIAYTSQLTHAIAVSLVNSCRYEGMGSFIGDSYFDLTRIAMINENLWSELFIGNNENLISEIEFFQEKLNKIKTLIKDKNVNGLKKEFKIATTKRKTISLI